MRAGNKRGMVEKEGATSPFHSQIPLAADPACHPLTFSIVLTDRDPGTGYSCFEKGCPTKPYATMPKCIMGSRGLRYLIEALGVSAT